jgi:hypothetical protein
VSPTTLPIRGEKRIVPQIVNVAQIQEAAFEQAEAAGSSKFEIVFSSDFYVTPLTEAKRLLNDFIKIRVPHRGVNATTLQPDVDQAAEFQFLINPKTISVSKQTVDTQAFTRGGWQFGVWGEDISEIRISGQSAGSYFALGLTDEYQYYAISYRNLLQLQQVFENNGYWFEGEEYNEGPLAADYLRRRIRMHQDLELWVGNFIWSGMFESMNISQAADNPFLLEFEMTFLAWKERYRSTAGYWDSIHNDIQRGHSYPAVEGTTGKIANDVVSSQVSVPNQSQQMLQLNQNSIYLAPSVNAAASEPTRSTINPQVQDTSIVIPQASSIPLS